MRWILVVLMAVPALGQSGIAAQRASIARQRAAVLRQRQVVHPVTTTSIAPGCMHLDAPTMSRMIDQAARETAVPAKLVREVVRQESGFQPCAVSRKGAEGLMQLMPATQASLGVRDAFNPIENLTAGARLLKELLARYGGNLALALSAYNAGPSRVDQARGIPEIDETQEYVAAILRRLAH